MHRSDYDRLGNRLQAKASTLSLWDFNIHRLWLAACREQNGVWHPVEIVTGFKLNKRRGAHHFTIVRNGGNCHLDPNFIFCKKA
jgi:hypothetical protein